MIKQVGHELALSLERFAFIFRFVARIQILGLISSEANLFINQEFVFFEVEGNIWDICYAVISARVSVMVPWQDQMWMIAGEFGFGTRSFPLAMSEALTRAAENFGQTANDRLTMAQDSLDTAIAKLEDGKSWLDKRKADVDKANIWFDSAVNALRQVEDSLDSMRDKVKEAKDWLREKQRDIDKLCKIRTCKKLCVPGVKWETCTKSGWGFTIHYPCLRSTSCMFEIPDVICIGANVICAAIRALAFVVLKIAEAAVGVALLAFDATKLLVQAAQIVVDKSRVVLEIAKVGFDLAKVALTVAQETLRGAQQALETVKILVAAGIEVFKFIVRYGLGAIVDIKRSWFEIEVSTFNIFVFDVGIEVELFRLGMRDLSVTINFKNFLESVWNAAVAIIKTIAEFLLPFRKRRSIESGFGDISNSYNQSNFNNDTLHVKVPFNDVFKNGTETVVTEDKETELRITMFEEKCIIFEELADYLTEAMTVLYDIAFDSNDGMGNASDVLNGIDDMIQNITNIEKNNTGINVTEAYFNYNLTEEEIELAITDVNITENPVVNESVNALVTVKDTTLAEISSASDYHILAPWKQMMMNYTAQVFTEDECASFEDCLFYTFDQMYDLYENVDLPNATTMRSLIIDAKQQFFAVLRNDSLRIADAEAVAAGILDLLQESRELKIFCATPPTIIQQPSSVTTLEGSNITLFCTAEADPMASYTWYKDGRIISSAVLVGQLHLITVSDSSRGWYFCQAGNHVVNITSVEVYVDVHKVPVITAVSEYKVVLEGEEPPIVLSCNSTGWPLPSIRWFFASAQSTYMPLDVKADFLLLEKPRLSQTGSYTCEASNVAGKDTSKEFKITVVGTSFAVPVLTASFEFYDSVLYEDHVSTCGTSTMEGSLPLHDLQDAIGNRLQNILGIDAERVVDLAVRRTGQGVEINGEVRFSVLAGNMPPITSTVDSPYEQLESMHGTARKELSVLGNILQEASFQEQVMFEKDGCRASLKSGTMAWSNLAARCPAGYHGHDTKIFLCVCCAPGQYRADAVNSSFCLPCPFGTYQHSMCSSSCIPCPDGLTTNVEGSADVDKCNVPVLKPTPTNITESQTKQTMEGHATEISVGCAMLALLIGCSIIVIIIFIRRRRRTKKWSTTDDVNHSSNEPDQTANELAVLHCNPLQPAAEFDNPVVPH
ncbi:uncharacterized protein [Ptychodera flava]|uniref:uncharacterized protein n=1 Tax=Ptychodera flava TaxID=63121 RepID=UPI003969D445